MRRTFLGSIRWLIVLLVLVFAALFLPLVWRRGGVPEGSWRTLSRAPTGSRRFTLEDRLAQFGPAARGRLAPYFQAAGIHYPPAAITLAAFKDEGEVQVYAQDGEQRVYIRTYTITAGSGVLGPKLREGDFQVPEGFYPVTFLNPNSRFHLSLRLGYPNTDDQEWARLEGRTHLGGDIMIHGNAVSIGCIAVGDVGAEDLFVLAADTGMKAVQVLVSPVDFRRTRLPSGYRPVRPWVPELYRRIEAALKVLPSPAPGSAT